MSKVSDAELGVDHPPSGPGAPFGGPGAHIGPCSERLTAPCRWPIRLSNGVSLPRSTPRQCSRSPRRRLDRGQQARASSSTSDNAQEVDYAEPLLAGRPASDRMRAHQDHAFHVLPRQVLRPGPGRHRLTQSGADASGAVRQLGRGEHVHPYGYPDTLSARVGCRRFAGPRATDIRCGKRLVTHRKPPLRAGYNRAVSPNRDEAATVPCYAVEVGGGGGVGPAVAVGAMDDFSTDRDETIGTIGDILEKA